MRITCKNRWACDFYLKIHILRYANISFKQNAPFRYVSRAYIAKYGLYIGRYRDICRANICKNIFDDIF